MNEDRFQRLMRAIDPELLEEAQTPVKRRSYKSWAAAALRRACALPPRESMRGSGTTRPLRAVLRRRRMRPQTLLP